MTTPPKLTDRSALTRNRGRADAMFLQAAAADDVQERLQEVNRTFTTPAVVTGFPATWAEWMPSAKVVEDTETLDLEEGAHDLVVHALSLHWADDPIGQLVQCRRALRPDGLFIATLFSGQTLHELRSVLAEAEVAQTGGLSPRVLPMAEVRDLGGILQRAGFALPVADILPLTVTYDTPIHLMRDLRAMGESNAMAARQKTPTRRTIFAQAMERYADAFAMEDGRIPATFEFTTLTGWAPSESQPKPLRPGSATTRLSDALGTVETPLDRSDE
ncbi:methyltransferase domain-containing protein [Octadecabacter sp. 1_MG-2023]|uniref:methyltransferase domain-containing protein n=1 Tax=unclassified Octadecabacter TaxID=196158 RepID=UPI001C0A4D5F|nr:MULTISPECIES: methyltransferase domain-containing protein [unclassified Octadecabacter]MBU2992284.1 methyltransferase domain-containing protein [Octadecabacter sp. B2R22]MDO6734959.1 methyltransferase domain-containing protein [Octadecabacter sp. 1_MG-2023]